MAKIQMFLFFLYTCSDWYKLCFRNCVVWMGSRWCNRITFNPSQLESVQAFLLGLVQISSYEWQNNYCFQTMIYKINIIVLCIWRQSMPFVYLSIFQFSVSAHHITHKHLHGLSLSAWLPLLPQTHGDVSQKRPIWFWVVWVGSLALMWL